MMMYLMRIVVNSMNVDDIISCKTLVCLSVPMLFDKAEVSPHLTLAAAAGNSQCENRDLSAHCWGEGA